MKSRQHTYKATISHRRLEELERLQKCSNSLSPNGKYDCVIAMLRLFLSLSLPTALCQACVKPFSNTVYFKEIKTTTPAYCIVKPVTGRKTSNRSTWSRDCVLMANFQLSVSVIFIVIKVHHIFQYPNDDTASIRSIFTSF